MPDIAIYFTDAGYDAYPFTEEEYMLAYHIFAKLLWQKGARAIIVRSQDTYRGGNRFAGGWAFDGERFLRTEETVEADVIFNRGKFAPDDTAHVLNDPALNRFCDDKAETYRTFDAFSPRSFAVANQTELEQALKNIPSALIVSKPIDGLGGEGITIGTREEVRGAVPSFPYIVQEFIDTSGGIPGICGGMHDFRMIGINGEIVSVFIREPKNGSYLANVSQGARIWELPVERAPTEARALFETVDRHLSRFPRRVYCTDVARGKDGRWTLIELNAEPGLSSRDYEGKNDPTGKGEGSKRYFQELTELLLAAAKGK